MPAERVHDSPNRPTPCPHIGDRLALFQRALTSRPGDPDGDEAVPAAVVRVGSGLAELTDHFAAAAEVADEARA